MLSKITEGDRFKSPFTGIIFEVRRIHTNTVLLEDVKGNEHQLITEIVTLGTFYQKVGNQNPNFLAVEKR